MVYVECQVVLYMAVCIEREKKKKNRKIERRKKRGSREKANPPERNYDEYRSLFSSTMAVVMSPLLLRSCETALEMKRRTRLVVRNIVRG